MLMNLKTRFFKNAHGLDNLLLQKAHGPNNPLLQLKRPRSIGYQKLPNTGKSGDGKESTNGPRNSENYS
jgi:hypothetical protein